ncbi:RNA pseudouridylate synthase domain-containing protein 1-like isoform X2 [Sitophilus oryzae]|uniref:RNA pseudouridylate synthase domain-containing protein 1-like isoform X2 n=1 Tax=Sitophilus oryzae TaxID=7048 RepID=A0A6J2X5A3_SITOR|nr:RNA pseudouridylate synthase domain-containing protein 1-like isoform X2 [Sitophilus oryzae]
MFSTFYFIWVILFISQIYFIKKYFKKCDTCQIIHRSDNFLIINKQADIKINSNNKNEETVQTFLRNTCPELTNQKLFHEFYFPHRLDYSTSGILCIPKTREVCKIVSAAFSARTTKKYYVALVRGVLSSNFIDVNISVGDDLREPQIQKMCTSSEKSFCKNPRSARTIVMALEQGIYNNYPATKILCRPITGRRHQIRVHCTFLGHTIIGDYTYSNRKDNKTPRMYLHAIKLVLPNKLEDINVFTDDPFTHIKGWKKLKLFQSLSSGYIEIDRYSNSLNCL